MPYLYAALIFILANLVYGFGSAVVRDWRGESVERSFRAGMFGLAVGLWVAAAVLP